MSEEPRAVPLTSARTDVQAMLLYLTQTSCYSCFNDCKMAVQTHQTCRLELSDDRQCMSYCESGVVEKLYMRERC